jgi:hypothetical protein
MSFAMILLLVVLFSGAVLLRQYVTGSLTEQPHDESADGVRPEPLHRRRIDHAA